MTNAKTAATTAAEMYAARRADIARLMNILQVEMDGHAHDAAAKPNDWGFAGDLGRTRMALIEQVAAFGGVCVEAVEAQLDDAR